MATEDRKKDHLRICLEEETEIGDAGFGDVSLVHNSMPEIDFEEINTSVEFCGKKLRSPLMIAAVTGGIPEAKQINKDLAEVAERKGIGFGLGSQRAMIERPERKDTYSVRGVAPRTLVLGNLGISHVGRYKPAQIRKALDSVKADGLCVHVNPAQEMFQLEGDLNARGQLAALAQLCKELGKPVIAKEVGNGISYETAVRLKQAGVFAIDVGGYGGTSWVIVEGLRSGKDTTLFNNWGIPTACSILEVKKTGLPIIATGGVRSGSDMAKSIALGASLCGMALPFLRVLNARGKKGVAELADKLNNELKTAMFLTGSQNIGELKKSKYVLRGKTLEWATQRGLK